MLSTNAPGPRSAPAPMFPYVPNAGSAKALGFSQPPGPLFGRYGSARIWLGRWMVPFPFNAWSSTVLTFNGGPVWATAEMDIFQSPAITRTAWFEYVGDVTTRV